MCFVPCFKGRSLFFSEVVFMIKVTLKDGSVKEFNAGITAYEAAK